MFASTALLVSAAPWEKLGPHNIGDAVNGQGYAGTLADAASPLSNPKLIYTGGHNNGAASGVLKSLDRGQTWIPMCNGLWDTTIGSLIIVDDKGDHVLAGTPTGIYETKDGAASWTLMPGSTGIGWARSMMNGTINGEPRILAGADAGLASWDPANGGNWTLNPIPAPIAATGAHLSRYITVADVLPSSVVGTCLGSVAFIITIKSATTADWRNTSLACAQVAIDPNDPDHFIYSNMSSQGKQTWESRDGGKTSHDLNSHYPFHVLIDRRGWLYHAAEHSADFSTNGGKNWSSYQMTTTQRLTNATGSRVPMDYQRIVADFAGGVAFVSDQGLFIQPADDSVELIGACGNMSTNIAISPSISKGDGTNRWIVTTAWDWGPLASWDEGAHWPGWNCPDCEGPGYTHGGIGEGGFTRAFGSSNHVLMVHHTNVLHSSAGGKNFTRVGAPTSMPWPIYTTKPGSRVEPDGRIVVKMAVAPPTAAEAAALAAATFDDDDEGDDDADDELVEAGEGACDAAAFPTDLGDSQCQGLTQNPAKSSADCCAACVGDANCETWNWCEPDGRGCDAKQKVAGCWVGRANACRNSTEGWVSRARTSSTYLVINRHFGAGQFNNSAGGWVWGAALPPHLVDCSLTTSPVDGGAALYAVTSSCIATSTDEGATWSACWGGLDGEPISGLVIKDASTMFVLRSKTVPLRTKDGGKTWSALHSFDAIAAVGFAFDLSWTGNTIVVHGLDTTAIAQGSKAPFVWRSTDDGDTFVDETDDVITNHPSGGSWFEGKYYLTSSGQGIMAKTFE